MVAVNVYQTVRFLGTGRGQYREALAAMATGSESDRPGVVGNRDMDHVLTIAYHSARLPERPSFVYYCVSASTPGCERHPSREGLDRPPEYYVLAAWEDSFVPPPEIDVPGLANYVLDSVYPKYGLSGSAWAVYRAVR